MKNSSIYYFESQRAFYVGYMGTRKVSLRTTGTACANYPDGGRRHAESKYLRRTGNFPPDCTVVATTLLGSSSGLVGLEKDTPHPGRILKIPEKRKTRTAGRYIWMKS
jgi:hypothetical protein